MSPEAVAPDGGPRSQAGGQGLRIGVDARLADGRSGGIQQFVIGLASGLSRLRDGDEEYVFLAYREDGGWLEPYVRGPSRILWLQSAAPGTSPSRAQRLRLALGERAPAVRALWRTVRPRLAPQVVEVPASDGTIEEAGIDLMHFTFQAAFTTSLPSVYQPWDLQHVHLPEFFSEADRRWRDVTYKAFCEQARLVVVASSWTKQDLVDRYGIDARKIAVVGVPAVTSAYETPAPEALEQVRHAFSLPPRFIYFPAQTWAHKNHLRLLAALRMLRDERGMDVRLVCTGAQNAHFRRIQAEVRRLGLHRNVQFIGFVDPVQVRALYVLARAMVFPSLFEGWGLPVLEAFEAGLPVACSTVTSLPDLAGDAALLFDPTDVTAIAESVARLWSDDALCRTLASRGQAVAARYTWDRTARTFRALYRLVGGRPLAEEDRTLIDQACGNLDPAPETTARAGRLRATSATPADAAILPNG
jgi:glycosyltransferase involved in cell wall biosynthesis